MLDVTEQLRRYADAVEATFDVPTDASTESRRDDANSTERVTVDVPGRRRGALIGGLVAIAAAVVGILVYSVSRGTDHSVSPAQSTSTSVTTPPAPGPTVPTYDLHLDGARLVDDESSLAGGLDAALWKAFSDDTTLSLLELKRDAVDESGPRSTRPTVADNSFPSAEGRAWFTDRTASPPGRADEFQMWWQRADGDAWLLTADWGSDHQQQSPDIEKDTLRAWALSITQNADSERADLESSDPSLTFVDFDPQGDRPSRRRVWSVDGQQVTLLVLMNSYATEFANLLQRGESEAISVGGQSGRIVAPSAEGDTSVGWKVPGDVEAFATLTIPSSLSARTAEIVAALSQPGQPTITTPSSTTPLSDHLTRPVLDVDGCALTYGRTFPAGGVIKAAFASPSSKPIAFQVFGDPTGSLAEPFAIVERFFADQKLMQPPTNPTDINGHPASAQFLPIGRSTIRWRIDDGSEVYVRSDSLTEDQMLRLARALTPRPTDSTVPGFDLAAGSQTGMTIVDENFGPFTDGPTATSQCVLSNGGWLNVALLDSRPLVGAVVILDRPKQPTLAIRQFDDGRLLLVTGRQDVSAYSVDAISTVREATDSEWSQMVYRPSSGELVQPGFPVDQDLSDVLGTGTYGTWEHIRDVAVEYLAAREGAEVSLFSTVNFSDYYELVITLPVDGQPFIAKQWDIQYEPTGGTTVYQVHAGFRCPNGVATTTASGCGAG